MNLKAYIQENPFFLAPMAGVTVKPFRSFMREMGCGVMTSELVSARALKEKNSKTLPLIEFEEHHKPYGIQIFGESADIIAEGAKRAEDFGVDFIDLNLGCPVNKIVKKGAGSALLKDLKVLKKVLSALKSSVNIPVSLKIRTGWDHQTRNSDQVAQIALEEGFEWMSLHGRTRSQAYSGKADWNYIKQINSQTALRIVGNGDLMTGEQACSALKWSSCFAVMIGRACLNDPWIFLSAREHLEKGLKKKSRKSVLSKDYNQAMTCLKKHLENFYEERLFLLHLKKFAVWFSSGFPHSTEFRRKVFRERHKAFVIEIIEDFFNKNQSFKKTLPVYEPFLMQGHG
ncbi:MAG: tRNA-dihydrouridine synthase [Bdellovibrionales bacterium]|nr:tRNA-dihydrouridine synthase [Bdellovibrionales bacterium]